MLILQIKLTLAAFVHQGIHRVLPSFQHVSRSSACLSQPLGFLKGLLRPKLTRGLQQQSRSLSAKCLGKLGKDPREANRDKWNTPPHTHPHIHRRRSPTEGTPRGGGGDLHPGCRFPPLNTLSKPSQDKIQDRKKGSHKTIPFI